MSLRLIGKKKGMTQIFDQKGNLIVCSVLEAEPNVIVQIKDKDKDGYQAVQLGGIKVPRSKELRISANSFLSKGLIISEGLRKGGNPPLSKGQ